MFSFSLSQGVKYRNLYARLHERKTTNRRMTSGRERDRRFSWWCHVTWRPIIKYDIFSYFSISVPHWQNIGQEGMRPRCVKTSIKNQGELLNVKILSLGRWILQFIAKYPFRDTITLSPRKRGNIERLHKIKGESNAPVPFNSAVITGVTAVERFI